MNNLIKKIIVVIPDEFLVETSDGMHEWILEGIPESMSDKNLERIPLWSYKENPVGSL